MWTTLLLLFLLFGGMLVFSLGQRFYFFKKGRISLPKLDTFSSVFLCLSIVAGGTLLYGDNPYLPIYTWVVILLLLWILFYFSQKNWTVIQKTFFCLALCAAGVFGVLMPLPQANLLYWLLGIELLLSWFLGWRVIVKFDKYPMTSYLVSSGWCVALLLTYFILKDFPPEISLFAAVLGVAVYVICRKRLSYGFLNLGPYTAEIVGFIWSGIWTICLLETNIFVLLLVYGYYVVEMSVLLVKFLNKKPLETLLTPALENEKNRKKAISLIFFHVVVMGILAATLTVISIKPHLAVSTSLILAAVICLNLYNHLKDLDHRIGSWKDIFSELKKGLSELPKASKDFAKEVKSSLQTQPKRKTKPVKKTARNKNMIKKRKKK